MREIFYGLATKKEYRKEMYMDETKRRSKTKNKMREKMKMKSPKMNKKYSTQSKKMKRIHHQPVQRRQMKMGKRFIFLMDVCAIQEKERAVKMLLDSAINDHQ